ncbi:O-antigen ligase family protein [Horticoccus luteus]|uniref:O-antigen ligase family protein n=1 Tax=Horticoccus luteus TaxID=2862869 RepID=A0A8F9TSY5_9BACT|nr:O-antigen ligase family protein [Horticoccus luteus]QYM77517.1 O-antigen ligase family protein [Horticoccus luteus]
MNTLDFSFAPIAAILCFAVYFWLLWKFPTGIVFIGFTTYGIAWTTFGGFNYARIVFFLQLASAAYFTFQVLKTKGTERLFQFLTSKYSFFLWFIVLVWIKVAFDLLYFGLDDFRVSALKIAAQTIFLPWIVFFIAAVGTDPWRFASGIMIGMVAFALAFVLPTVPGMIMEGRLLSAVFGIDRLTIYNMDTIGGGRFFFMGAVGSLALLTGGGLRRVWVVSLTVLCGTFFLLLLLNGTRQFIIGTIIATLMCSYSLFRTRGLLRFAVFAVAASVIGYFAYGIFQSAEVGERFSGEDLSRELAVSRGAIWSRALDAGLAKPFVGEGFRRFGDVVMTPSQTGEEDLVADLSGAHGFFQDIWAEHGAVWGGVGFVIFLFSIRHMLKRVRVEEHSVIWALYAVLIAMVVPLFMSGSIYSSGAMYLFASSMYIAFAKHKMDLAQ